MFLILHAGKSFLRNRLFKGLDSWPSSFCVCIFSPLLYLCIVKLLFSGLEAFIRNRIGLNQRIMVLVLGVTWCKPC